MDIEEPIVRKSITLTVLLKRLIEETESADPNRAYRRRESVDDILKASKLDIFPPNRACERMDTEDPTIEYPTILKRAVDPK